MQLLDPQAPLTCKRLQRCSATYGILQDISIILKRCCRNTGTLESLIFMIFHVLLYIILHTYTYIQSELSAVAGQAVLPFSGTKSSHSAVGSRSRASHWKHSSWSPYKFCKFYVDIAVPQIDRNRNGLCCPLFYPFGVTFSIYLPVTTYSSTSF